MIAWRDVHVRLAGRPVVDGVRLEVPAGQRVALVGPNGAGKTTLLRTLLGLVPYTGQVEVDGLDARRHPVEVRRRVGYVPQLVAFPHHLTTAEIVALVQELRGLPPRPGPVLEEAGLLAHARKPVRELSGGMLRKLGLAVGRVGEPPVLVLDEPTSYLDRDGEEWLLDWLRTATGRTVVVASHQLRGLDRLVDRVVVLEEGRVVADLSAERLHAMHWLEVVVPGPLPKQVPEGVQVLASRNGAYHLRVPDRLLREVLDTFRDRSVRVHEPPPEELVREVLG